MTEMPDTASPRKEDDARPSAAERMRRSRKRRRDGLRCYIVEVFDREVATLIDLGLLLPAERGDPRAVVRAVHTLLDRTLGEPRYAHPNRQ
jgi:hypothetical protein